MNKETEEIIRELMRELFFAYHGTHTLPAKHEARIAYNKAEQFLEMNAHAEELAGKVGRAIEKQGFKKQ